jgi:hypothetical protein
MDTDLTKHAMAPSKSAEAVFLGSRFAAVRRPGMMI